jgi:hypothetical protein
MDLAILGIVVLVEALLAILWGVPQLMRSNNAMTANWHRMFYARTVAALDDGPPLLRIDPVPLTPCAYCGVGMPSGMPRCPSCGAPAPIEAADV